MDNNQELFESRPIPRAVASLAVPTIISQLIVLIYNLADTFFIGQTNDPYMVAASSMAYVLFFLLNALANLFGIGGGSLISRLLGSDSPDDASDVSALSLYGTVVVTAVYCLACQIFMDPVLDLMGASQYTLGYARDYTFWVVVVGGIPATLSMAMSHLLRSAGHGTQAGFGLTMGGILNIFLDPLFMFVIMPSGKQVAGAAIATMLSNVAALVYYIVCYARLGKSSVLSASLRRVRAGTAYLGRIISVGFPSAVSTILVCVSIMVCNSLVSAYGDIPLAALGIVKKIDMLPHNIGTGLCQGVIPLIAYNYASGDHQRMKKTISFSRGCGLVFTALCIIVFELFAVQISLLFIKQPETAELTTSFLRIMCLATPLTVTNFHMCYTMQAMGKGRQSLLLSACRQGLFNIPLLFLMDRLFGVYGVIWTQFFADLLTLILSVLVYNKTLRAMTE